MLNSKKQTGTAVMPYLRNINLRWGGFDLTDVKQMDIFPNEVEQFTLRNGDLLICEGGEPGRCAVWNRDGEMAFQNAMHRVRPHAELSPQFLALQFEAKVRNGELEHLFSGVTIKHFSQSKLRAVEVPLPPLAEQERIVSVLEEQFSKLDKALEVANQLEARIASERRSLLHAAFTGELTSQWRKTHV
jgi:type I restriction enzyme S subunit